MKHAFSLLKNINPLPDKRMFSNIPLQSVDYSKRDSFALYVNNKIQEIIVVVYCLTLRNEKCVYISTNKTSGFKDCDKCKASCHLLKIPPKEKQPTLALFDGDVTYFSYKTTNRAYGQPSHLLMTFRRQSQSNTAEPEPKKTKSLQIRPKRVELPLA